VTSGARRGIPAASGHGASACSADLGARHRMTTDFRAFRKELNWRQSLAKKAAARKDRSCHLQFCSESM
jgi:hypothetical protein